MQYDVPAPVLQALSRVSIGYSSPTLGGLWVTRLMGPAPPAEQGGQTAAAKLWWAEDVPPHPARLVARNPAPAPVVVPAGTVLVDGMSARSVRVPLTVAARGWVSVSVEPLGARWWDEGAPRWRGRLGPVGAALLLHTVLDEAAVAASARTALSSLGLDDLVASPNEDVLDAAAMGWVLSDAGGAVAAWLVERGDPPLRATPPTGASRPAPGVVESLRAGIRRGMLVAHVLESRTRGLDVAVLPRDLQLVDHVNAAMHRETGG